MANNLLLLETMGYVVPAVKHQFGSLEEDKALTNQIAMAVGNELAYDDCLRMGKIDWLPEIEMQIDESWHWVETCIIQAREMCPVANENLS